MRTGLIDLFVNRRFIVQPQNQQRLWQQESTLSSTIPSFSPLFHHVLFYCTVRLLPEAVSHVALCHSFEYDHWSQLVRELARTTVKQVRSCPVVVIATVLHPLSATVRLARITNDMGTSITSSSGRISILYYDILSNKKSLTFIPRFPVSGQRTNQQLISILN